MEHSPEETRRAPLLSEAPPSPMHDAEEMEEIECGKVEAVCRCCGACQGGPQHDVAAANKCVTRLLAWIAMNLLVYAGQRAMVAAGLPSDGIDPTGRRATFILESVQMLILHACGTAIFAHVLAPERRLLTRWTANAGFFVVASVTGCVFSLLSDLTPLETPCRPVAARARPTSPSRVLSHFLFFSDCGSTSGMRGGVAPNSASCRIWLRAWLSSARTRHTSSS